MTWRIDGNVIACGDADHTAIAIALVYGHGPHAERNKRLIAAAPRLLAALEAVQTHAIRWGNPIQEGSQVALDVAAAIAEARGQQ